MSRRGLTTSAQAEGAIEGSASDYQLKYPFATQFKYSRFDATSAPHRDVARLTGKRRRATNGNNGKSLGVASAVSFDGIAESKEEAKEEEQAKEGYMFHGVASTVEAWSARVQGWVGELLG